MQCILSADMRLVVAALVIMGTLVQFGRAQSCSTFNYSGCNSGLNAQMKLCIVGSIISRSYMGPKEQHMLPRSTWKSDHRMFRFERAFGQSHGGGQQAGHTPQRCLQCCPSQSKPCEIIIQKNISSECMRPPVIRCRPAFP